MAPDEKEEFEEFEEPAEDEVEDDPEEEVLPSLREDKIFNNRYNTGDGLINADEYSFSNKIAVSSDYSDAYLRDLYEYEDGLEVSFILNAIFRFFKEDAEIKKIIFKSSVDPYASRAKLSKEDVNLIFNRVNEKIEFNSNVAMFYSPIYIVEAISSISSIEYRKLFDMFETDVQEMLLIELNKKYHFLDGKMHKKRIH